MHKLAIGKRNEFMVWAWLLKEGFDVFPSLVDDKGIDGVVGHSGKYFEIQVKSGKNWSNQRGIGIAALSQNPNRIFLILNYTEEEVRYFTAKQILDEAEWQSSIRWDVPQIQLPQTLLEKYKHHNWGGFVKYLRDESV